MAIVLLGSSSFFSAKAEALTPLPDVRSEFFAGEWIGVGPSATYCHLKLEINGKGALRYRQPNGSVVEVKILKWINQNQRLVIESSTTPLEIANQMNGTFSAQIGADKCQMAKLSELFTFSKSQ